MEMAPKSGYVRRAEGWDNLTGWLCKIKLTNEDDIRGLMDEAAYKAHCEGKN